ncbi:MAG: L-erythro-3,5-diaminohexanoate dehydrogenase [Candidatus Eremiobacteraeota bacterium]|nr:L-erythro-3,5-diaminohexanoate dehydrogenase [Candidatus Eremiobacteraeota bacterium]
MKAPAKTRPHRLGIHRVVEPAGAMPQDAWRIDNTPVAAENEMLCEVDALNIDSASFRQLCETCDSDGLRIGERVMEIVGQRGKQHNPVTGSGGMFVGRVLEIGSALRGKAGVAAGDRIASLVSLTLTPLHIDAVIGVDVATGRVRVRGKAILFESGLWARLPSDVHEGVALAVLDVAGAPAQVRRLCSPGQTVLVIGADGKSGLLSCAQAKARVGTSGRVIGLVPDAGTASAALLLRAGLVDELIVADARRALETSAALEAVAADLADVVINCVNVSGTELGSILCAKDGATIYFFSMATSFTAAALGAEGVARDVTMIIGNGYTKGHAEIALQTLRDHPALLTYFTERYGN